MVERPKVKILFVGETRDGQVPVTDVSDASVTQT